MSNYRILPGHGLRTACARAYRIRLGADHGVHLHVYLSALALRRHTELIKVSLSLSGEPWPNHVRQNWDADDEEIRRPPTTHLVATVDDLTDMLDFDSEDIDGMDDDVGDKEEPLPTGH